MAQYVEVNGETIEFPDGMSDDDIAAALSGAAQSSAPPAETEAPAAEISRPQAAFSGLSQGLTFGTSDEIGAALGSGVLEAMDLITGKGASFSDLAERYRKGTEALRTAYDQEREAHPGTFLAGEVAGGLATGGTGAAKLGAGKGLKAAMKTGGASGAAYGAGTADADNAWDFITNTFMGGAGGAAGGAFFSGAGHVGKKFIGLARPPETRAVQALAEADPDLAGAISKAKEAIAAGKPAQVGDFLTRRAQSIIKGAGRRPGDAQTVLAESLDTRAAGQYGRLLNDIDEAFGVKGDYTDEFNSLVEAQETLSGELYETAFAQSTKATPELRKMLRNPAMQQALNDAQKIIGVEGGRVDPGVLKAMAQTRRESPIEMDTRTLHLMRRALDDKITSMKDPVTGKFKKPELGNAFTKLRTKFANEVKGSNASYREADNFFGGIERAKFAMESGVKAGKKGNERDVRTLQSRVKDADNPFFRLGFAQGLTEKIGGSGSDFTNRALRLNSPEQRKAIESVLGSKDARALLDKVDTEMQFAKTRSTVSPNVGSHTQELANSAGVFNALRKGDVMGLLPAVVDDAARAISGGRQDATDAALARLVTGNPDNLAELANKPLAQMAASEFSSAPTNAAAAGLSPLTVQLLRGY